MRVAPRSPRPPLAAEQSLLSTPLGRAPAADLAPAPTYSSALALPSLAALPPRLDFSSDLTQLRPSACGLVHAGIFEAWSPEEPLEQAINRSLSAWLAPWDALARDFEVEIYLDPERDDHGNLECGRLGSILGRPLAEVMRADWPTLTAGFTVARSALQVYTIGPTLLGIEARCPALAHYLIHLLSLAHARLLPIYTVDSAFDYVAYAHWQGEVDEKERLIFERDNMESEAEPITDEALATELDLCTRAAWDSHFPAWTFLPKETPAPAAESVPPSLQPTLAAALALHAALPAELHGWRGLDCSAPLLLEWQEYDFVTRFFDDQMNEEFSAGEHDVDFVALFPVDPTRPETYAIARQQVDAVGTGLAALHQLLPYLGTIRAQRD